MVFHARYSRTALVHVFQKRMAHLLMSSFTSVHIQWSPNYLTDFNQTCQDGLQKNFASRFDFCLNNFKNHFT